jgi:adenosylmethionine-8-amino-7-oxononanoate aminotransferase
MAPALSPQEILDLDRRHVWHPYSPIDDPRPPLLVERAQGARLFVEGGRALLDGNSQWWTAGLGHNHPRLVAALTAQAQRLCHVSLAGLTHEPAALLARDLVAVAPPGLERVFFSDDGSTAVEAAIKMAVQYFAQTGRPGKTKLVGLVDAFHGETAGVASLGGVETFRRASGPLLFDALHAPTPAVQAGAHAAAVDLDANAAAAFASVSQLLAERGAEIAAVIVEPIVQAAAGMQIYPASYLAELRAACTRHDVLLIADEVFTGYGRTGPMWACDHAQIAPDLMCLGKTFAGGMLPIAATLATERIAQAFGGSRARAFLHGHTFCGNPLGTAVAREALAIMRDEDVLAGVARKERKLRATIDALAAQLGARATRPRALGMICALDLVAGDAGGGYLGGAGWRAYDEGLQRGAYLRPLGDTVYLAPPLTISDAELDELCQIFVAAVGTALGGKP